MEPRMEGGHIKTLVMISELRQRRAARYAIAIALTGFATPLTVLLRDELDYTHTILLFAAVVGSAYIGGLGPGLVSGTLGILLLDWFLFPPEGALKLTNANEFLTLL